MREQVSRALRNAQKSQDRQRVSALRLINAAIQDRDIANRGSGKDAAGDDEILQILTRMVKQREESAKAFDEGGRPELAAKERAEIDIVREFLPARMSEEDTRAAVARAVSESGAESMRDMGKVMAILKERHTGSLDFSRASGLIKEILG